MHEAHGNHKFNPPPESVPIHILVMAWFNMHVEGSPRGKSLGGKIPLKKSPAESTDISPVPVVPAPSKPGSEEWVYVNEPIPEVWQFKLKLVESLLSPLYSKIHIAPSKRPFLADNICIYQKSRDDWEYSVNHIPCFSLHPQVSESCFEQLVSDAIRRVNGLCEDQFSPQGGAKMQFSGRTASPEHRPSKLQPSNPALMPTS